MYLMGTDQAKKRLSQSLQRQGRKRAILNR